MPTIRTPLGRRAAVGVAGALLAGAVAGCDGPPPAEQPARPPDASGAPASPDLRTRLAATWRLVRVERRDQNGDPLPEFVHRGIGAEPAVGYLMYDGQHFGRVVQRETTGTQAATSGPVAPLAALARYTAEFGRFAVDEQAGHLTHRIAGSLDPGATGTETLLRFELAQDRLVLMPPLRCPDSFVTDRGCGYGTTGLQLRSVWERLEPAAGTVESARQLLGFWELDRIERRTDDGDALTAEEYAAGYLMYMPSGHVAVHLMRADRPPYAGSSPTPAEAEAAIRGYLSYFGPFRVLEEEDVVVHERIGHLEARSVGSEARRAFARRDGQLLLEPPPATDGGETARTTAFWNRLGPPREPAP